MAPWRLPSFEITNWPFMPFMLLTQLNRRGSLLHSVFGFTFVLTFVACRLVGCTWLGVRFITQVQQFLSANPAPSDGATASVVISLVGFLCVLALSYYWFIVKVMPQVHHALKELLGDTYHHPFIPRKLRELIAALSPEARRARRLQMEERAERMRALEEMRAEALASAAESL